MTFGNCCSGKKIKVLRFLKCKIEIKYEDFLRIWSNLETWSKNSVSWKKLGKDNVFLGIMCFIFLREKLEKKKRLRRASLHKWGGD